MSLTGDFPALARLQADLNRLAEVPSAAAREASRDISRLLAREFATSTDPYGRAWKPLKRKRRGGRVLVKTGALKAGTVARPLPGAGIGVELGASYGLYHQTGTRRGLPRRPILPDRGLPASWNEAVSRAVERAVRARLRA